MWVQKLYGRTYMGIQRATFVIDAVGKLLRSGQAKVDGHAAEVLTLVQTM